MTSITICDARHPVSVDVKNGDSISLTSMSLIYDFYNITKPQEMIKFGNIKDQNDKEIYFQEYTEGLDFNDYYVNHYDNGSTPILLSLDKIRKLRFNDIYDNKLLEYKILSTAGDAKEMMITNDNHFKILEKMLIYRCQILYYFRTTVKFKYVNIISRTNGLSFNYPSLDSGIDDYIHELVIRYVPEMYEYNDDNVDKIDSGVHDRNRDTVDNIVNWNITSTNRKYYFNYIQKNLKVFNLDSIGDNSNVFKFLRVNNYIHGILKYVRDNQPDYYDTIKDLEAEYYVKGNVKNTQMISIIDKLYGGNNWKCFTNKFIDRLGQTIYTTMKQLVVGPGFYSLNSLLNYHLIELLEFDYNKYTIINKRDRGEEESVVVVRPVGSDSTVSHGELYDILWSPDSGRRFPDIIGSYKNINIHCEQVNGASTVFIDHNDASHYNKIIGTIEIEPSDNGEFFGIRNKYDNERKIYFKLACPVSSITHLNFYFTDCNGNRIDINSPVRLNVIIQ